LRGKPRQFYREFWALRDISFEVKKGEIIGIIGRNGSGKSTLLQIIAGTLTPTAGEVQVNGQVTALLELGSGFNPEFTGRENVYLNGSILGFSHAEMEARFDEIAAFADIGQFLDQPVKLYSSGMFVRLAFAVQACVEPEVLIVDEALTVGDIFFRQKCYQRIETLRERGTSIILVTHSMLDIGQFCQRALLLHRGEMLFQGIASEAVKHYYLIEQQDRSKTPAVKPQAPEQHKQLISADNQDRDWPSPTAFLDLSGVSQVSNGWARCTGVAVCNSQGQPCLIFQQGDTASFFYEFELLEDIEIPIGGLVIQNDKGIFVHGKNTLQYGSEVPSWVAQGSRLRFRQDITLEIAIGAYTFQLGLSTIDSYYYQQRDQLTHQELNAGIVRLCHLPSISQFNVIFRSEGKPIRLLHHGLANLPGKCQVIVE
jgi:lipopolysaccharide transport system ATP-binding protein